MRTPGRSGGVLALARLRPGRSRRFHPSACPGTFTVRGAPATEGIVGLPAPLQAGATLLVIAEPQDTRDAYPLTDVRTGYQSEWLKDDSYYALLALGLLIVTVANMVVVIRRRRRA